MDASLVDYYAPVRNESLSSNEADAQRFAAMIERAVLEVLSARTAFATWAESI